MGQAKRLVIAHSSRSTCGLYCNGKNCFEVITRRQRMGDIERYYCSCMHSSFDPHDYDEDTCPRPKRKPKFNRGDKQQ